MTEYICKECKHCFASDRLMYFINGGAHWLNCRKSFQGSHVKDDPVLGQVKVKPKYEFCSVFRMGKSEEGRCGTDAYYWEPKHKKNLFKFMKKVVDNG
jgi:hypothetical protein